MLALSSAAHRAALPEKSGGGAMARIKSQGGALVGREQAKRSGRNQGYWLFTQRVYPCIAGAASP